MSNGDTLISYLSCSCRFRFLVKLILLHLFLFLYLEIICKKDMSKKIIFIVM